jgi:hypothetical protein
LGRIIWHLWSHWAALQYVECQGVGNIIPVLHIEPLPRDKVSLIADRCKSAGATWRSISRDAAPGLAAFDVHIQIIQYCIGDFFFAEMIAGGHKGLGAL